MATKAVLLAAGRGRRIAPYHRVRPKALLPVANRPLIRRTLDQLAACGVDSGVVVASPAFASALAMELVSRPGFRVVVQAEPIGTAAAAALASEVVADEDALVVLYADTLFAEADLAALVAPTADGVAGRVLGAAIASDRARDFVCVDTAAGEVRAFWGHPRHGSARVAGAFLLSPSVRRYLRLNPGRGVRVEVGGMPPLEQDLCESLNLALAAGARLAYREASGHNVDLDKPWDILAANRAAVEERFACPGGEAFEGSLDPGARVEGTVCVEAGGRVEAGVVVRGRLWVGPRSVVRQGAICEGDVMLGADVRLEDYAKVENCVIGDGSVVSHCAEVLGGVLMRNVWLMHHCELYGVLGDDVDIGAATVCGTLRFDDGETAHRVGGRWETPSIGANAAYLGDHVRTGVNVTILPGRHVGPFSAVGPGIVVAEDVPEGTLVTLRQELDRRPFGPDRYGW